MSTAITWNGVAYSVPASGEVGWANLSNFLIALGNSAQATTFQKVGTRIATTSPVTVVAATDCTVITNLGVAGAVAVNLPAGVDGQFFAIVDGKGDAQTNNITITPFGAETINGAATLVINSARGAAIFVFKTGNWSIISRPSVTLPAGAVTQDAVALWNSDGSLRNSKLAVDDTGATAATLTTIDINQTANRTVTIQDATQTLIGRDTTDQGANRLQNKDLDDASSKIVDSADTTKKLGFDVSGTAGTTQTLATSQTANRTLTLPDATDTLVGKATTDQLTNKDYEGGTATDASRLTVPKAATATLNALTRKQATVVYDTSLNQLKVDDGTNLQAIGGGSGELTFVTNPNDAGNWSTTGANGPTGATTSTAGNLPLSNFTTAIQLTSTTAAGAEASNYFSYSFTTGASYAVKTKVEFWLRTGTNFLTQEWTVSVYQGATRVALTTDSSGVTYIPAANGKFTTYFDAVASTAYTVRFSRPVNAGSNAAVLNIANVIVGPGIQPQGAVVEPWQEFTPTVTNITISASLAYYRRVGDSLQVQARVTLNAAPTGTISINFPAGLTADTTRVISNNNNGIVGTADAFVTSNSSYIGSTVINDATNTGVNILPISGATGRWNATIPVTFASGDQITVLYTVPIAEWAGSGTVNLAQNDVEYASNSDTTDAANTTSFAYGPSGSPTPSVDLTASRNKRVRFNTPIQATDVITLEISQDSGLTWWPIGANSNAICRYEYQNGTEYGIGLQSVTGSTDVNVTIARYRDTTGATFGSSGAGWSGISGTHRWRLVKSVAGQAVGFGLATATSSGLVTLPNSMMRMTGQSGFGSTNTSVIRMTTTTSSVGDGFTYASSATLGDTWTINRSAIWGISASIYTNSNHAAITLNTTGADLTANLTSVAGSKILSTSQNRAGGQMCNPAATVRLDAGDVIRIQCNPSDFPTDSSTIIQMVITEIVRL